MAGRRQRASRIVPSISCLHSVVLAEWKLRVSWCHFGVMCWRKRPPPCYSNPFLPPLMLSLPLPSTRLGGTGRNWVKVVHLTGLPTIPKAQVCALSSCIKISLHMSCTKCGFVRFYVKAQNIRKARTHDRHLRLCPWPAPSLSAELCKLVLGPQPLRASPFFSLAKPSSILFSLC